jgi:hypothetical protein
VHESAAKPDEADREQSPGKVLDGHVAAEVLEEVVPRSRRVGWLVGWFTDDSKTSLGLFIPRRPLGVKTLGS